MNNVIRNFIKPATLFFCLLIAGCIPKDEPYVGIYKGSWVKTTHSYECDWEYTQSMSITINVVGGGGGGFVKIDGIGFWITPMGYGVDGSWKVHFINDSLYMDITGDGNDYNCPVAYYNHIKARKI